MSLNKKDCVYSDAVKVNSLEMWSLRLVKASKWTVLCKNLCYLSCKVSKIILQAGENTFLWEICVICGDLLLMLFLFGGFLCKLFLSDFLPALLALISSVLTLVLWLFFPHRLSLSVYHCKVSKWSSVVIDNMSQILSVELNLHWTGIFL